MQIRKLFLQLAFLSTLATHIARCVKFNPYCIPGIALIVFCGTQSNRRTNFIPRLAGFNPRLALIVFSGTGARSLWSKVRIFLNHKCCFPSKASYPAHLFKSFLSSNSSPSTFSEGARTPSRTSRKFFSLKRNVSFIHRNLRNFVTLFFS